jgi:acetolactate synthase-1/2/3 large subunit
MYTLQSLWTQAHENLNVVTVLFSNRSYKILLGELERVGIENASPTARAQFELTPPDFDWIKLSEGMGVPAERAGTAEDFIKHLEAAIASSGPHLIEVVL